MLAVGAVAAGLHGVLPALGVLVAAATFVAGGSLISEPAAAVVLAALGWLTVAGFSQPPYGQLRLTGPWAVRAAITMAACSLLATGVGLAVRWLTPTYTPRIVDLRKKPGPAAGGHPGGGESGAWSRAAPVPAPPEATAGVGRRRQLTGVLIAAATLPLLTMALTAGRQHFSLDDDLLIYLVVVVAIAVVGGFWPAVSGAIAASLLLNWYFTLPLHTFTIEKPQSLLALLLFVTVAITVSSVVHLAARRAAQAAASNKEAASLLALAQTILGGADTPAGVLGHLTATLGGCARLLERVQGRWVPIAVNGGAPRPATATDITVRDGLMLSIAGQPQSASPRLLDGFAAQAAAALDRERLRTQAAQAEALAEGNRMRTALLAAVSHDLRTPLASIKASVSTLRQADVALASEDEAALLATIEESADRLGGLISNLLDMSRLTTSSLHPLLQPTSLDEVVPVALHELDVAARVRLSLPDDLPFVLTDPGLLERALANLLANAVAYSPPARPAEVLAAHAGDIVVVEVVDHGPGVHDALKHRIFEPFERLDAHKAGTGVGLGLAVAKGFAEAVGASIAALDTPGGGLTMQVTLPVAAGSAARGMSAEV
jgi:two-component system, OmpR family, sensor histidine kinase KdpD